MRFQEIARLFGLTNEQFAEAIGYKRQSLYQGIRKTSKSQEAIARLHDLNDHMLELDIEAAHRRCAKRKTAIREFANSFRSVGYD